MDALSASLQIVEPGGPVCLRVSGVVAPSAPTLNELSDSPARPLDDVSKFAQLYPRRTELNAAVRTSNVAGMRMDSAKVGLNFRDRLIAKPRQKVACNDLEW
ncbi:hypothetical protein BE61_31110 [Bradyrhizobium elkanii USDA 61]|nr:hypothetical protein BE61_31110 [Bradyrhizobium elkanii USDA 61]